MSQQHSPPFIPPLITQNTLNTILQHSLPISSRTSPSSSNIQEIKFVKIHPDAIEPKRMTNDSIGYDLFCPENVEIPAGQLKIIDTGISLRMSVQTMSNIQVFPTILDKSSYAASGLHVMGRVIDHGYTGNIKVIMMNLRRNETAKIQRHQPFAQIVFVLGATPRLVEVNSEESAPSTERGDRGFGQVTAQQHTSH